MIGNSAYPTSPLANPGNDADDVAATLRSLSFVVTLVKDVSLRDLEDAVRSFRDGIRAGDIAVVFFAGHGVQVDGATYLVPIDDDSTSEVEVRFKAFAAQRIVDELAGAGVRLGIVILDACRNNPYRFRRSLGQEGLASLSVPRSAAVGDQDFAIIYSTQPGNVALDGSGRNSPFASAFIESLRQPGLSFATVLQNTTRLVRQQTSNRQEPWVSASIGSDYVFNDQGVIAPPPLPLEPEVLRPDDEAALLRPGDVAEFVRRVEAGGVIHLGPGTFRVDRRLTLSRDVELIGAGQTVTTIRGTGDGAVVLFNGAGSLILSNLTIEYAGTAPADVVWLASGTAELQHIMIQGGVGDGQASRGSGIHAYGTATALVRDAIIRNNDRFGLATQDDAEVRVASSAFSVNRRGIAAWGTSSVTVDASTFERHQQVNVQVAGDASATIRTSRLGSTGGDRFTVEVLSAGQVVMEDNDVTGILLLGGVGDTSGTFTARFRDNTFTEGLIFVNNVGLVEFLGRNIKRGNTNTELVACLASWRGTLVGASSAIYGTTLPVHGNCH